MRASHRWLALGIATAVLVAGCGGSSKPKKPTDVQAVGRVVKQYLSALAAGNGPAACKLMTKAYQSKAVRGAASECAPALSTIAYQLDAKEKDVLFKTKITRTIFSGDTAQVYVKGEKGAAKLTKQKSGDWLLSGGSAG